MSAGLALFVFLGLLLIAIGIRLSVGIALFVAGIVALLLVYGTDPFVSMTSIAFTRTYSWELVSMPLFIFMGLALLQTGISSRLYRAMASITWWLPGGLINVNIGFSAVFAAMTGSDAAAFATITAVAVPEFNKRPQYDMSKALGSCVGGGVLGSTIPPSIVLIVYGALTGESIASLFMGGIIVGLVEGGTQVAYVVTHSLVKREGRLESAIPLKQAILHVLAAWPAMVLIFLALVSIYTGVATPSEAGALGATGALVIGFAFRELNLKKIWTAAYETARVSGLITLMYIGAAIYSFAGSSLYIPQKLTSLVTDAGLPPIFLVIAISLLSIGLGMIGGTMAMLLVVAPIVHPVIEVIGVPYGWDGIWLGVLLVLLLDQGNLTPPVGYGAFIVAAFAKRPNEFVFRAGIPFLICIYATTAILIAYPQLATWLPSTMK